MPEAPRLLVVAVEEVDAEINERVVAAARRTAEVAQQLVGRRRQLIFTWTHTMFQVRIMRAEINERVVATARRTAEVAQQLVGRRRQLIFTWTYRYNVSDSDQHIHSGFRTEIGPTNIYCNL